MSAWKNTNFVYNIYNDNTFRDSVDEVFDKNQKFFEDFVRTRFERELAIYEIKQERNFNKSSVDLILNQASNEKILQATNDRKYRVYVYFNNDSTSELRVDNENFVGNDSNIDNAGDNISTSRKRTRNYSGANIGDGNNITFTQRKKLFRSGNFSIIDLVNLQYAIVPLSETNTVSQQLKDQEFRNFEISVPDLKTNDEYVWAVWKKFTRAEGNRWSNAAKPRGITVTNYFWDIMEPAEDEQKHPPRSQSQLVKIAEENVKIVDKKDVSKNRIISIEHLNIMFELLRYYYALNIDPERKAVNELDKDLSPINCHFCYNSKNFINPTDTKEDDECDDCIVNQHQFTKPRKITIKIDHQKYRLDWWNNKGRTECNAFVIKDISYGPPYEEKLHIIILADALNYNELKRVCKYSLSELDRKSIEGIIVDNLEHKLNGGKVRIIPQKQYAYQKSMHDQNISIMIRLKIVITSNNLDDGEYILEQLNNNIDLQQQLLMTTQLVFHLTDEYLEIDFDQTKLFEKKRYYLRFKNDPKIEWQWYDNDQAYYAPFSQYKDVGKRGLLNKQLEAIFQANTSSNFFEHRIFNNSGISHLVKILNESGKYGHKIGIIARYSMSASGLITTMEQVNIQSGFHRPIKRLRDGKNSLFFYWKNTNDFIEQWKTKYLLSSYQQQKCLVHTHSYILYTLVWIFVQISGVWFWQ